MISVRGNFSEKIRKNVVINLPEKKKKKLENLSFFFFFKYFFFFGVCVCVGETISTLRNHEIGIFDPGRPPHVITNVIKLTFLYLGFL